MLRDLRYFLNVYFYEFDVVFLKFFLLIIIMKVNYMFLYIQGIKNKPKYIYFSYKCIILFL